MGYKNRILIYLYFLVDDMDIDTVSVSSYLFKFVVFNIFSQTSQICLLATLVRLIRKINKLKHHMATVLFVIQ